MKINKILRDQRFQTVLTIIVGAAVITSAYWSVKTNRLLLKEKGKL